MHTPPFLYPPPQTKQILVSLPQETPKTQVILGENILHHLSLYTHSRKTLFILDASLEAVYGKDLLSFSEFPLITIPAGETAKTEHHCKALIKKLHTLHIDKETLIIAVGGGSITDLVGFVASVYLRGIDVILIPTSLLGMVDASIGGKTAINFSSIKNTLGTLYHPLAVLIDLRFLTTLPNQEWFHGLAEIAKIALVYNQPLWNALLIESSPFHVIAEAIETKIHIIQEDPCERSIRRILQFGHTIGHALESLTHYTLPHGQAIALGVLAEAWLSRHRGYLSSDAFDNIVSFYQRFSLRLPDQYTPSALLRSLLWDKKTLNRQIRCVLIDQIGHALSFDGKYCCPITPQEVLSALSWVGHHER